VTCRISLPPVFFRSMVDKLPNTLKYERLPDGLLKPYQAYCTEHQSIAFNNEPRPR
jgi:hypothetical protein